MSDLRSWGIRLVIGAVDNDAFYIKKLEQILSKMGDDPTMEKLEQKIREADFAPRQLQLIMARIDLLRDYVTDGPSIASNFKPGDLILLDLRQDFMDRDTALAFFTVLMEALSGAVDENGVKFNKAIVFDEAHKFMSKSSPIREQVGSAIKEMRHRGMWVLIATQDPSCMSDEVTSLCTLTILHRLGDKRVLKWLQEHNIGLSSLTMEMLIKLMQAEVYVCATRASDGKFVGKPFKLRMRHPCTEPGGSTRTAVS